MDHSEAKREVLFTTRAFLMANGDREKAIEQLVIDGFSEIKANLRVDLIPIAFGWALLKKMGVESFPSYFELPDSGEKVNVSGSHVFLAALDVAIDVFENGYTEIYSERVIRMLVDRSAEVDAMNRALNAEPHLNISQVKLSSSLHGYSVEEYESNA
jgi:hypothetical protein